MSQKLEFTGVLLAILLLTGFVEALKCYEDEPGETKSKYKAVECDPDVKFCAKLVNDNGVSGSEVYRACATQLMCRENGHFKLVMYNSLHYFCCSGNTCNSSSAIGFSALILVMITVFYRIL